MTPAEAIERISQTGLSSPEPVNPLSPQNSSLEQIPASDTSPEGPPPVASKTPKISPQELVEKLVRDCALLCPRTEGEDPEVTKKRKEIEQGETEQYLEEVYHIKRGKGPSIYHDE